jgi:hypothetical protein
MKLREVIEAAHRVSKPYRITKGKKFRLEDVDAGDTGDRKSEGKPRAREALQTGVDALAALNLHYPTVSEAKRKELAQARKLLLESA